MSLTDGTKICWGHSHAGAEVTTEMGAVGKSCTKADSCNGGFTVFQKSARFMDANQTDKTGKAEIGIM